jgi:hypothetical protein
LIFLCCTDCTLCNIILKLFNLLHHVLQCWVRLASRLEDYSDGGWISWDVSEFPADWISRGTNEGRFRGDYSSYQLPDCCVCAFLRLSCDHVLWTFTANMHAEKKQLVYIMTNNSLHFPFSSDCDKSIVYCCVFFFPLFVFVFGRVLFLAFNFMWVVRSCIFQICLVWRYRMPHISTRWWLTMYKTVSNSDVFFCEINTEKKIFPPLFLLRLFFNYIPS